MRRRRCIFTGASASYSGAGKLFPQPSINSPRTAHVWRHSSNKSPGIAETHVGRRKRHQSRLSTRGMGGAGGRRSRLRPPRPVLWIDRLDRGLVGDGTGCLPAQQVRRGRPEALLVANDSQRRQHGFHPLAGAARQTPGSRESVMSQFASGRIALLRVCLKNLPNTSSSFSSSVFSRVSRTRTRTRTRTISTSGVFRHALITGMAWLLVTSSRAQTPPTLPSEPALETTPSATVPEKVVLPESVPDPIEPFNRGIYALNKGILTGLVKPTAKVYRHVVVKPIRTGIGNFGKNITFPGRLINNVLQWKWDRARDETWRFCCNTTVGVAGFMDVATKWKIPKWDADFGQTLGQWGWKPQCYVMLPIFGPSNERDTLGLAAETAANPLTYFAPYSAATPRLLTYISPY